MAHIEENKSSLEFHVISLEDQIGTAIRTALSDTDLDVQPAFDEALLVEISRAVIYHVGFEGDMAYAYEDVLVESIVAFAGHLIEERNLALLNQVIKSLVEPFVKNNDYYDFTIEEDDVDGSEIVDQIGEDHVAAAGQRDTGMRAARKRQINLTDSITSASNNNSGEMSDDGEGDESKVEEDDQDRVNEWMDQVMAKSEQEYLAEESEYSDAAPDEPSYEQERARKSPLRVEDNELSSDSPMDSENEETPAPAAVNVSQNRSFERPLYHLTSSDDDTLHSEGSIERKGKSSEDQPFQSFQSPAPYQIRKSAAAVYEADSKRESTEPLPAWLMPKSPLDEHFRKGYGGLGKADLQDTIDMITSTQKKILRASRIADDNELSSENSGSSSSSEEEEEKRKGRDDDDEDNNTDLGELDEPVPAWLMPKSPLDAHFRKGYGGLGHADLEDAIEEITTAQKKAQAHIRASARVADEFDALTGAITVEDLPDDFGIVHHTAAAAVSTPTQVRPARRIGSSGSQSGSQSGSGGGNHAKGTEYAKQQKLFQSPKPSRIPVAVSSAKKRDTTASVEDSLPAWQIPKSPLDAQFRKAYGGLGHEDLNETIAEITASQKKAQRTNGSSLSLEDKESASIMRMLEDYYDKKDSQAPVGKKVSSSSQPKKLAASRGKKKAASKGISTGGAAADIMFDSHGAGEEKSGYFDANSSGMVEEDADLLPSSHPSTSPPHKLTNNPSLNEMMKESFQRHLSAYSKPSTGHIRGYLSGSPKATLAKTSRSGTPQSKKTVVIPSVSSSTKPLKDEDFAAYLRSPELKHNFDEIDALIRQSQKNLAKMKIKEKKARSGSFVSAVSLTDHESQEARPKAKKVARAKLTKRASAYAVPDRAAAGASKSSQPAAKVAAKAQKLSSAKLHEQNTGNVRHVPASMGGMTNVSVSTAPVSWSRRSSSICSTMVSKLSQSLLNEGHVRLPSPRQLPVRSSSPVLAMKRTRKVSAGSSSPNLRAQSAPQRQRILSTDSRLLVPTTAALIRSADIATNASRVANIHNEWPQQLRTGDCEAELSSRKAHSKLLRRSLPAGSAEQIIDWYSPDKKSKSVDFLYGLRRMALDEDHFAPSPAAAASSPPRRRASTPTYAAPPLASGSRLRVPTVNSVMRSLVTAQQSPVIRRLEKSVHDRPSKTYLLHGEKLAKKLEKAQQGKPAKRRKTKKRKTVAARS